jgi:hypothetical protein
MYIQYLHAQEYNLIVYMIEIYCGTILYLYQMCMHAFIFPVNPCVIVMSGRIVFYLYQTKLTVMLEN